MSEELHLTRRGLLQMVSAIVATASFAARRPLFGPAADANEPIDLEIIEDEPAMADRARDAKLEAFLRSRGIRPAHFARESGYSRQHLLRIRLGRIEPTGRAASRTSCRRVAVWRVSLSAHLTSSI